MGTLIDGVAAARQDQIAATAKMNVAVRQLQERAEKLEKVLRLVIVEYEHDAKCAISLRAEKAIRTVLGEGGWGGVEW